MTKQQFASFLNVGLITVLLAVIFLQPEPVLASTVYVLDNFTTAAYNNQNGTANWTTNWIETNDDSSASTGEVLITGGVLRMNNSVDGGLESIERQINMPINSTATLSFNLTDANLEAGDIMILEIYNGVTWTTLQTYNGNTADGVKTFDVTSYRSSNTRIRFRISAGFTVADEFFNADDVRVSYWSASTHTSSSVFQTVQTYYVPIPEDQGLLMLATINAAAIDPMYRYVSITIDATNTIIYYDHWEDDFEAQVTDPKQATTEVWGDGNTANGIPPGFATDVLTAGSIIILNNTVASTNLGLIDFDGGDKISSTNAIAVTSTSWPSGAGTLHGGSVEMLDTSIWGTRFDVPADAGDQANDFDYAGITVMASEDNTSISRNGTFVATINEGQSYLFNDNVNGGDQITADKPVQVNFLTGDIGSNYESSWYTLYPFALLSSDYYAPVDRNGTVETAVYIQNPNASAITVHWTTTAGAQADIGPIAAGATARVLMPNPSINSGARFYTGTGSSTDPVFQAISAINSGGQANDWGYTLIPADQLTQQAQAGWGVGRDPTNATNPTEDGSPIWVAAVGAGTMNVCADYNGDGVGALTDSNGSHYDQLLSLANLARAKVYDTDGDQTGMLLYLCNGSESANSKNNKIAAAWGQEPGVASNAAPGLDVGTSVPPLPNFTAIKNAVLTNDVNGNGRFDTGDTFEYRITINNVGALPIPAGTITVEDIIPLYTTYVANSTARDGVSIPDSGSGTAFPLDAGGYLIPVVLPLKSAFVVTFRVTIGAVPGATTIQNDAHVSGLDLAYVPKVEIFVGVPSTIGDYIWLDRDGDGVQDAGEPGIAGVTVELSDAVCTIGSTCPTAVTDANGGYIFTQVSSGTYTVIVRSSTLPTGVTQTGDPDATLNNQHTLTVSGGDYLTVDFGYQGNATISNYVWNDVNSDGVQDATEAGISGVTIWVDLDNNGVRSLSEPFAVTDSNGLYSISGLYAGTYVVRADVSSLSNVTPTYDLNGVGTPNVVTGVTLTSGQTRTDVDWGYWNSTLNTTAIGNSVWLDEDGNGYQDAGEAGIPNITVQLWNSGHTTLLATTVTDVNGNYVFKNVSAGTYQVDVLDSSLPSGLVQTTVIGGTSDSTNKSDPYTLTVVAGVENMTADFGYNWAPPSDTDNNTGTGTIGDRIWIDNGNGIQEPGEPGLYNVSVQLLTPGPDGIHGTGDDVVSATTTTNYAGYYVFDGLAAGSYVVRVNGGVAPLGAQTGDPDQFGATCTTCDNQTTTPIVLSPGDVYVNADFGYQPSVGARWNIGDTLWLDSDRAGDVDAGELRLAGVTVALIRDLDNDGVWDSGEPIIATDITDTNGNYLFTNLPVTNGTGADDYLVWVNDTENVLSGLVPVYDSNGTGTPNISAVTDMTAADNLAQDFGYAPVGHDAGEGMIGDTIYYDRDAGADYDLGEGLEGVKVNLYLDVNNNDVWDAGDTLLASAYTNENGQYFFGGLAAGEYVIRVDATTLPTGVTNTVDPDAGTASEAAQTLTAGQVILTRDFGYRDTTAPNTISGTLWRDTDADGLIDAGETVRFQNITVVLRDNNGNIVATTTTDASGNYSFGNLPDGTYAVDVADDGNLLDGYWHSLGTAGSDNNSQSDLYTVTVSGGQTNTTADFGYYRYAASIGDFVWDDTDGDGIQDVGELGISGATVTLTITWPGGAGTTTLTTTTNASGAYSFGNLLLDEDFDGAGAGEPTFLVTFTTPTSAVYLPSPADQGADDGLDSDGLTEPASPVEGGAITNIDSGFIKQVINIGDTLWYDWDGDGTQDANEPGIPNIDVFVDINNNGTYDAGTDLLTATNANGQYNFLGLALGTYRVIVNTSDPQFPTGVTQTGDPDSTFNNEHTLNGSVAGTYNNVDFGYQGTGSISNYVWNDIDGDGVQDGSESGISGVTVWVDLDNDGTLDATEPSAVTDANGQYYIGGLYANAGGYVVRVNAGVGSPVNGATATYDVDGGAVPASTANIATVTLTAGQNRTDVDWGYQFATLNVTKVSSASGTVNPGDTIQYAVTVRNNTASQQTGIVVSDTLPTGATYVAQSTVVNGFTINAFTNTYSDNFDPTQVYTGNDGSQNFSAAWIEDDAAQSATAGDVQIVTDLGDFSLRPGTNPAGAGNKQDGQIYRVAGNLSACTTVTLAYDYRRVNMENTDFVYLDMSNDGGSNWTNAVATITNGDDAAYQASGSLNVAAYKTNLALRFRSVFNDGTSADDVYIDNVVLTCNGTTVTATTKDNIIGGTYADLTSGIPSTLVTAADTYALNPGQTMTVTYSVTVNNPVPAGQTSINNTACVTSTQQATQQCGSVSDLLPRSFIGDRVWLDENSDGVQDAGESGIPNVRVFLDTDNDGVYDLGETYVYTDTEGNYIFTGVTPGAYNVAVDTSTLPTGLTNATYDENNGTTNPNSRTSVTTVAGQEYVTSDFGYNWATTPDVTNPGGVATGSIGDRVWIDADSDGIQDPGEAGLSGVTVNLITAGTDGLFGTADDVTAASTSTGASGSYIFDGLSAGAYVVQVSAPGGYTQTGDPDSTLDNKTTAPILLAPGDVYVNADFGYQPSGGSNTIGNQIFVDTNGDGNLDGGEPGIPGVTVALLNNSGTVIATTVTNTNGQYSFPGLPNGTYTVWVNDTANVLGSLVQNSTPNNAVDGGQACGTCNKQNTVTVSGSGNAFQDFGFAPVSHGSGDGLIGDTVYLDRDGGNDYDSGEGLEGVTVRLYTDTNADGNYDAGEPLVAVTTTNENGNYYFGNLPAGNYVVRVDTTTLPTGVTNTVDVGDATLSEGGLTLAAGGINLAQDFGYRDTSNPNTISGTIWRDTNADGALSGESGRFNAVTVVLRNSSGNIIATTTTDASGNYSFPNLPDGTFTVDVTDDNNVLNGYWHSTGGTPGSDNNSQSDTYSVTVSGGQTNTTADFGYYRDPAIVGNQVWLDRDNDGVKDADEPGIPGVTVTLTVTYPNGSVTAIKTTTVADGIYAFNNLLLDENHDGVGGGEPVYSISVSAPPSTTASPENAAGTNDQIDNDSDGASENATITKGETDPSYDFGFYTTRLDLGDLPDTYKTLFSPGPAHVIFTDSNADNMPETTLGMPAVWLGNIVDTESNGVPGASASGDDAATIDDEDGLVLASTGWTAGNSSTATVTINSNQSGVTVYFGLWIDWDNNGTLETFYNGSGVSGSPTSTNISVAVPGGYIANTPVYMRVRADDQSFATADFEGTRINGEVEDYWFQFDAGGTTTPITLSYFKSQSSGKNTNFNWSTATETGNVGFNLYVQGKNGLNKINTELIPSKVVDSLEQQDYSLSSANVSGTVFYIEDVSILGETRIHGPFRLGKEYGAKLISNKIDQLAISSEHENKTEERQTELEQQIRVPVAALKSTNNKKPTATPKATKSPTPTATPKATKTLKAGKTPRVTATVIVPTKTVVSPTSTPEMTMTPVGTPSAQPTNTLDITTEQPTNTLEATPSSDATPSEQPTNTVEAPPSPDATPSEQPTNTAEVTPSPDATPTQLPTETSEPTLTPLQYAVPVPVDASTLQLATSLNLKVNKAGLYRVTYEILKGSGLDLLGVPANKLTLINRDRMMPVYVYASNPDGTFGPGSYIEFYGEALDTLYTDTNIYTVQVSNAVTSIIPAMESMPDAQLQPSASYPETLKVNNQRKYASYAPGNDPWYDTGMLTYTTPRSWNFNFTINGVVNAPATLELHVWGAMTWPQAPDHHITVGINGTPVKNQVFDGIVEQKLLINLPAGLLHEGVNTIQLTLPGDLGVQYDMIALDSYSVTYQRVFQAQGSGLTFTSKGDVFTVTNLPAANVVVYRMRDNGLARLTNITVQPDGSTFKASFAGSDRADTYLVTIGEGFNTPAIEATRLKPDLNQSAQYLIISHPDFIDGLQPLIQYHQAQGLTVSVVNVNDLYTQYTDGIFAPQAISDYIKFATANLGTKYVLLVGGDTYDYRNYTGKNSVSFIPSLYAATDPTVRYAPVDPLYADLNNDNVPDLPIGRFPVRTSAELQMMVGKTLAYAGNNYGQTAIFAADKIDGSLSFKNINAGIASTLPAGWSVNSINLDDVDITTARQQLLTALNQGTSLVTFTGHSSATAWSFSNLLTTADVSSLTNTGRPFVAVQWGCWNTYYVDPVNNNLVQAMLLSGDRGAAASLGAVSLTQAESERLLGNLLTPRMVTPGKPIGQALQEAKNELARTHPELLDVLLGWTLMGDPALTIK